MRKARKGLMGVYILKNSLTSELFVGGSPSLSTCITNHFTLLFSNIHTNKEMQSSWNTFGSTAFEFSITEIVSDKSQLASRVEFWRKSLNANLAEDINLFHKYTGMLSVGNDTKDEIKALGMGSFDSSINELISFYKNNS
ncbi:GIY-YIG nuclease family protein [Candidatus Peregrinibacteria bacterium]|jgi:hypothetical protein|nr:GIY-YIG nuclease family protein [Candidatus Peregrinibacteria bacterium]MBT3598962.1 GIY-YIG nuclease family protein [Candidatus Peregrinibacteria bacterium]MBT4366789.1 GIY-YIG nuclease family protein [Candidatus Peregrinibacteria bacterium]MBT4585512.1 GIY-YIG nuclease family protein [Candidatus Peregrinibacteria bacterium]MBT6731327.1 GIY-YIG nuclease family protein [Candidatus Peregrinibacteria bacterium]